MANLFSRNTQLRIPMKFKVIEMEVASARLGKEFDTKNIGVNPFEIVKITKLTFIEKL